MVKVGDVSTFPNVEADKEQAKKVLEEAAEVYAAWQEWNEGGMLYSDRVNIAEECADLITATCNLLAALGVQDVREALALCELKNRKRGRY